MRKLFVVITALYLIVPAVMILFLMKELDRISDSPNSCLTNIAIIYTYFFYINVFLGACLLVLTDYMFLKNMLSGFWLFFPPVIFSVFLFIDSAIIQQKINEILSLSSAPKDSFPLGIIVAVFYVFLVQIFSVFNFLLFYILKKYRQKPII